MAEEENKSTGTEEENKGTENTESKGAEDQNKEGKAGEDKTAKSEKTFTQEQVLDSIFHQRKTLQTTSSSQRGISAYPYTAYTRSANAFFAWVTPNEKGALLRDISIYRASEIMYSFTHNN